jgi:L-amino acid N-acyltransferase YncA
VEIATRLAKQADAAAIARIYNQGIQERIATFETAPRSTAELEAQLAEKGDRYPTIVVERDGESLAWAGAGPDRTDPGRSMRVSPSTPSTPLERPGAPVRVEPLWMP